MGEASCGGDEGVEVRRDHLRPAVAPQLWSQIVDADEQDVGSLVINRRAPCFSRQRLALMAKATGEHEAANGVREFPSNESSHGWVSQAQRASCDRGPHTLYMYRCRRWLKARAKPLGGGHGTAGAGSSSGGRHVCDPSAFSAGPFGNEDYATEHDRVTIP